VLEPDVAHLTELLRDAAADLEGRRRRGRAAHAAAQRLSWDVVAQQYQARIVALASRPPRVGDPEDPEPFPLIEDVALRVLATPAWRAEDRLSELLAEWTQTTDESTGACLYLLADPGVDGDPTDLEARVLSAAATAGADLDRAGDVNVLMEPSRPDRDARLHAAVDAYVPLHAACAGHERMARQAGNAVIELATGALASKVAEDSIGYAPAGSRTVT
jgi:hypothetical protein